jgi:ribosomal protein L11 methyltransferase
MDSFWIVTLFGFHPESHGWNSFETDAMDRFHALGIEEYSLTEPEVDALLGERSYSGGDLPESVLDEVEEKILGKPTNYRFFFDQKENAKNFMLECQKMFLAEVQMEEQQTQDWNAEWKKHYAPIKVNQCLDIIPAWMKDYQSTAQQKIYINPGMGFGTGSHETTFLCLRLFTENIKPPVKEVLDFGSGSGILGLSVFKFFPDARVDFYDIDPEANKNCYQNAEFNNLENHSFRLLLPEVRGKLQAEYDLVFANILESILMLEKDYLVKATKAGGALILSGLLRPQVPGIIQAYTQMGLKLELQLEKGDWAALYFTKSSV